jgi:hypothetical protein
MTLILTQASLRYVLQVSDRLVTQEKKEFDPRSNKTIIYLARDALVSIAYSGRAYLDGTPTDQWIAEMLAGEPLRRDNRGGIQFGPLRRRLDIGQSIELLRTELGSAFARLPRSTTPPTLQIIVAGWQWGRKQARPIATHVVKLDASPPVFRIEPLPRYWHFRQPEDRSLKLNAVGLSLVPRRNPLSGDEVRKTFERLLQTNPSPDDSTHVLIDTIRLAASKQPRIVGEDCMCVYLPPPSSRFAQVVFVSPQEQRVMVTGGRWQEVLPATFSPWVIGPGLAAAPSIVVGTISLPLGPFTVKITAPTVTDDTGIQAVWSSQRRPLDPLRRRPHR